MPEPEGRVLGDQESCVCPLQVRPSCMTMLHSSSEGTLKLGSLRPLNGLPAAYVSAVLGDT